MSTTRERALKVAYTRQWRRRVADGYEHRTAGKPVARHITLLLRQGWSYRMIAEAAGVAVNSVRRTHQGIVRRPHTPTADAILAVGRESRAQHVISEVEHLIGWRHPEDIAATLGYASVDNLLAILDRSGRVTLASRVRDQLGRAAA